VLGPAPGAFTITAQDSVSHLLGETTGTLVQLDTPALVDITLQQSGTVTGILRSAQGNVMSGYEVAVNSSGLGIKRGVYTGTGGRYTFNRVAVGTIFVQSRSGTAVGGTHTTLTTQDETVTADVTWLALGTVRGMVLAEDGVTPVAGATVHVHPIAPHGPLGLPAPPYTAATTNAAGQYTVGSLPFGTLRIFATTGTPNWQAGVVEGVLNAAGPVDAPPLVLNNNTRWVSGRTNLLTDMGGYRYDLNCQGEIYDGSTNAYDTAMTLSVSGVLFPCASGATPSPDGRTTGFGPFSFVNAVSVTRSVFVPADASFARYVESFTNDTAAPITLRVQLGSQLGSNWNTEMVVSPASTGGTYMVTDNGNGGDGAFNPALGHVFAGAGATATPIVEFSSAWSPTQRWQLTIAPGQTASLMHFQVQRTLRADARAQAEALANLTDPVALIGLTPAQRASIVNFVVP
jgi:hypothetical protein